MSKLHKFLGCMLVLVCLVSTFTLGVFAAEVKDARGTLGDYVKYGGNGTALLDAQNKKYEKTGGGTIAYENLVDDKGLVTPAFSNLTENAKKELLVDMNTYADKALAEKDDKLSSETKTTWLQELQGCDGVGTQLMNVILQNTKPDYVTANKIYEPFSGVVGTCLALGAILIMAALGLTMVLDLSYIGIPAFRLMVSGDTSTGAGRGGDKPKIISHEAISAVQVAEGGSGTSGQSGSSEKLAIGIYFKKRVIMLIVLGICLLYLVQGQIFALVSMILDLVSGFIGF